ncbi:MAG TPA: NUDIX domain-containing protein [Thermomicrobiaceae bacterium]|nr:NUDIX domain-containing protein [Thermomicrobiaceae bacterium]
MSTDPGDELFDVLSEAGEPTGRVKRRAEVHRDGDWHRAFHLWVAWPSPAGPVLLFQRRASTKDTAPGMLDVAVGGHFRAGESLSAVVREIEEEIGLTPALAALHPLGTRRAISRTPRWYDRELQEVYLLLLERQPELRPHPVELAGLVQVTVAGIERLHAGAGRVEALRAKVQADGTLGPWRAGTVGLGEFVPVRDGYWLRGAHAARLAAQGETAAIDWETEV